LLILQPISYDVKVKPLNKPAELENPKNDEEKFLFLMRENP